MRLHATPVFKTGWTPRPGGILVEGLGTRTPATLAYPSAAGTTDRPLIGTGGEDRTHDVRLPKPARYRCATPVLAEQTGLEPADAEAPTG
jgi:hypothetical protein